MGLNYDFWRRERFYKWCDGDFSPEKRASVLVDCFNFARSARHSRTEPTSDDVDSLSELYGQEVWPYIKGAKACDWFDLAITLFRLEVEDNFIVFPDNFDELSEEEQQVYYDEEIRSSWQNSRELDKILSRLEETYL